MEKEVTISSQTLYEGKVISLELKKVRCHNGNLSSREIVRHPGGVCILGVLDDKIILEKQYRAPFDDFIIELPAGKLNKGEDPKEAACREFEEEVGYKANKLECVGYIYPSVGYTDEVIYLYIASDLVKTKTNFDEDENIELLLLKKEEVEIMLNENKINDAKSVILLQKFIKK